jgi:hypothetical protein
MKTMCSSAPTRNPSVKGTSCGKPPLTSKVRSHEAGNRLDPNRRRLRITIPPSLLAITEDVIRWREGS